MLTLLIGTRTPSTSTQTLMSPEAEELGSSFEVTRAVVIEHSSATCRIRSSGFDVLSVACRIGTLLPGPATTSLSPAATTLFAGRWVAETP